MSDGFFITADMPDNPKLLRCSVLARHIYLAMIFRCDHEGRDLADPMSWMSRAGLVGPAATTEEAVAAAIGELDAVRLAPRYEASGKAYVFLPGRFEHNTTQKYWRRSAHPLPPPELLEEFPEYARGLALLTTKSELRLSLRTGEARRYPHLSHHIPESGGQLVGNGGQVVGMDRDSSVPSRLLTVGRGGDLPEAPGERTRPAVPGVGHEPPPGVAGAPEARRDPLASPKQQQFAARILAKHDLTVAGWLERAGRSELLDSDIDAIRLEFAQVAPAAGDRAATAWRNRRLAALRSELREKHAAGVTNLRAWIHETAGDQHFEFQLLVLLRDLDGDEPTGVARAPNGAREGTTAVGEWA